MPSPSPSMASPSSSSAVPASLAASVTASSVATGGSGPAFDWAYDRYAGIRTDSFDSSECERSRAADKDRDEADRYAHGSHADGRRKSPRLPFSSSATSSSSSAAAAAAAAAATVNAPSSRADIDFDLDAQGSRRTVQGNDPKNDRPIRNNHSSCTLLSCESLDDSDRSSTRNDTRPYVVPLPSPSPVLCSCPHDSAADCSSASLPFSIDQDDEDDECTWKVQMVTISDDSTISSDDNDNVSVGGHCQVDRDSMYNSMYNSNDCSRVHRDDQLHPRNSIVDQTCTNVDRSAPFDCATATRRHQPLDSRRHTRTSTPRHVRFDDTPTRDRTHLIPSWRSMHKARRKSLWYTRKELKKVHRDTTELARLVCCGRHPLERGLEIQSGVTVLHTQQPSAPFDKTASPDTVSVLSIAPSAASATVTAPSSHTAKQLPVYSRKTRIESVRAVVMQYQQEFLDDDNEDNNNNDDDDEATNNDISVTASNKRIGIGRPPLPLDDDTVYYNTTLAQIYRKATEQCRAYAAILGLYDQKVAKDIYFNDPHQPVPIADSHRHGHSGGGSNDLPSSRTIHSDVSSLLPPSKPNETDAPQAAIVSRMTAAQSYAASDHDLPLHLRRYNRTSNTRRPGGALHRNKNNGVNAALPPGHTFGQYMHDPELRSAILQMLG